MKHGTKVTQVVNSAPRVAATQGSRLPGVAVGADERHELHHHDQRARRGLGKRQSAHHLPRREPMKHLDRSLGDIRQHGVGATEGDQRGATKEHALGGEDTAGAGERDRR